MGGICSFTITDPWRGGISCCPERPLQRPGLKWWLGSKLPVASVFLFSKGLYYTGVVKGGEQLRARGVLRQAVVKKNEVIRDFT